MRLDPLVLDFHQLRRRVQSHWQDEDIEGLPQHDDGDAAEAPYVSRVVCRNLDLSMDSACFNYVLTFVETQVPTWR